VIRGDVVGLFVMTTTCHCVCAPPPKLFHHHKAKANVWRGKKR
jgi:hypothetical protein